MSVERIGVSFEPELLREFDSLIRAKGYMNRSEAIRDLVRKALIEAKIKTARGRVVGALVIIYDPNVGGVTHRLLHLQHHHIPQVLSTLHIHLAEDTCLEIVVLRGKVEEVKRLADKIRAMKGVKHGELVLTESPS